MNKNTLVRYRQFLNSEIWTMRPETATAPWLLIRILRTLILALRGFLDHLGSMRANALTFYTLLSLVPLAAMAFGVAKGFGFERLLEREILLRFAAQRAVLNQVIVFAHNLLDSTKGGLVAGVGVVALFWSAVKVLDNIEESFNHIWAVKSRPLVRKFSDYLTIMLIAPILLIMSGSVTLFLMTRLQGLSAWLGLDEVLHPFFSLGLSLAPYAILWLLFSLVYLILPNTRVRLKSAALAGLLAGSAFQILQAAYVQFQINVTSYNAIYGSFAALPLFLIWLNLSWHIVLFGAEIAHAAPLSKEATSPDMQTNLSMEQTRLLALLVAEHVCRLFQQGAPAQTDVQIAKALRLPPPTVTRLAQGLVQGGILVRLAAVAETEASLHPARNIADLTIAHVLHAIDRLVWDKSVWDIPDQGYQVIPDTQAAQSLAASLEELRAASERSAANRLLVKP